MKSILVTFLFFVCLQFAFGQIPFAPVGAKYATQTHCPPYSYSNPNLYEITVDTIIQNKYCTLAGPWQGALCSGITPYVHSDGQQVFIYDEDNENFFLLYDFSKSEGESYKIKMCKELYGTDSATVKIESTAIFHFNGISFVRQKLRVTPDNDSTAYFGHFESFVYEGIGGAEGNILLYKDVLISTDCYSYLLCYSSPETGAFGIEGSSLDCATVNTDKEYSNNYFSISPNPSYGNIQLNYALPNHFKNPQIFIHNSTGQLHQSFELKNQQGKKEINNLPTGIYFITMSADGQPVTSKKLIIIN